VIHDTEAEITYKVRAVIRAADGGPHPQPAGARTARDDFVLHSAQSHNLSSDSGLVEVTAQSRRRGRDD
jgi:hypothetical protein